LQLINQSTSLNELNTMLTLHSIIYGDACFAYFNKIWGIPVVDHYSSFASTAAMKLNALPKAMAWIVISAGMLVPL